MPDIYELTNDDLKRAKKLFRSIPVYNPEVIRYTEKLYDLDIDPKLNDEIRKCAESSITSNYLSDSDLIKDLESFRIIFDDPKNPFKIKDEQIKNRYKNFINQYKNYFNNNNFLMPDNFEEFSFWFTACLHPTKLLFQLDIKDSDFKLFHDYKERLFNDNNWDEYKEAHLLNFYNTDIIILLSSNIIKEKREYRKLKKRISISIYQNILEQYEIYFDKSFSKNPNSFKLFLMWFARCQHPNESLENIDVTDKDIYQFIEYKDIKEIDRAWSDVQERERLKQSLNKPKHIEQAVQLKDDSINTSQSFNIPEPALKDWECGKLKVCDVKETTKDRVIYSEELAHYFKSSFKKNEPTDYFSMLVEELKTDRTGKEFGQIALMIYNSKHINNHKPKTFSKWFVIFSECINIKKSTYKKGKLEDPHYNLKQLFNYL